jgi:hypothetical protein
MEKTIEITKHHFDIILHLCKKNNIKLMVVLLPTKLDVEFHKDRDRVEALNKVLHLSHEDFGINRRLTKMLMTSLSAKEIDYLDLYRQMKNESVELFWKKDYHLNDNGHKLMAEIVYGFISD